jgi:hypothetical protein
MPSVLTASASVVCGHGGGAIAPKDDPQVKLTVSGAKVLTAAALIGQDVIACLTPVTPPPPGPVSIKCLKCTEVDSPTSTKLRVHGVAVLLAPLSGKTSGKVLDVTPQLMLKATGVQSKLTAV